MCENSDEIDSLLSEKTELIVNKVIVISEIKEILLSRVDLSKD
jgi:hypothetical protein